MSTVSDIIDALGGVAAISSETGIPFTTVHSWKRSGFVPTWRVPTLVDLGNRLGKPIDGDAVPVRRGAQAAVEGEAA